MKINILSFALALGILWGVGVFSLVLMATYADYAVNVVALLSDLYYGVQEGILGAFIGAAWGFSDAFIGGAVFAWVYNKLSA